jgi:hypothetical protein
LREAIAEQRVAAFAEDFTCAQALGDIEPI